jgi:beta-galactosidase GanA
MMRELARLSFAGKLWGMAEPVAEHQQTIALGKWRATLSYGLGQFGGGQPPGNAKPDGGALIAELGPDEYLVAGFHVRVSLSLAEGHPGQQGQLVRVEEGHFDQGQWLFERVWNGDQVDYGLNFTSVPQVLRVRLASF